MTSGPTSQCSLCKHFISAFDRPRGATGPACLAFPAGIPDDLFRNEADHRQPYPGDNGVGWEPAGDVEFPAYAIAASLQMKFDPHQTRDPNGKSGDGAPGPSTYFDLAGLTDVVEAQGTFGDLAMGIDNGGDVSVSFHEHDHVRHLDLGIDEVAELGDAVEGLVAGRDDLPDNPEPTGVYDDAWFGDGQHHKAELLGSGIIQVVFGADEHDPWTLELDPVDPESADVDDAQLLLDAVDHILQASASADQADGAVA